LSNYKSTLWVLFFIFTYASFFFFGLLFFCSSLSLAQTTDSEKSTDIDGLLDELFVVDTLAVLQAYDDLKGGFLYASISYDDQAYFSGRDFDIDQFGLAPSLTYLNSGGTYLFAGGTYYSEIDPAWDLFSIGAGQFWSLGKEKKWSVSASYNYSFLGEDSEGINDHRLSSSVNYKLNNLQINVAGGYLFGDEPSNYLSSSVSYETTLTKIGAFELSFEPNIYILFSQQNIIEQLSIFRYKESSVFDRINSQIELPLSFDNDALDINFSYILNFPNNIFEDEDLSSSGYFSISLGWLIPL
jgi:hypothetical protein